MNARGLALADLEPVHIRRFLSRPRRAPLTRRNHRQYTLRYLDWLHSRGLLHFDPDRLRRHPKRLPLLARKFLAQLASTHKPGTCDGYRSTLRKLHAWIDVNGLVLEDLGRADLEAWFQTLAALGLHPATRLTILLDARLYLRWLEEHGALRADPDALIRTSDMPKLPTYLPRPFPSALDQELQRRFAQSTDLRHHALLLMRRTGLRIGELAALEHGCVRTNPAHDPFLKVPLGKLDNERLVPLDPATLDLVRRLQANGPSPRHWLLQRATGRPLSTAEYRAALLQAAEGLSDSAPITSHRLRHSFATEMISGGMSLPVLMRLLGHRDFHMTLRYTAITDETIGREYHQALEHIEKRYRLPAPPVTAPAPTPAEMLEQITRWLSRHQAPSLRIRPLLKRIQRLAEDIQKLLPDAR